MKVQYLIQFEVREDLSAESVKKTLDRFAISNRLIKPETEYKSELTEIKEKKK